VCKVVAEDAAGVKRVLIASPLMQFNGVEHFPVDVALRLIAPKWIWWWTTAATGPL